MSTLKVNSIQHSNGTDALTIDSTGHATFNKTFIPANPLTNRNLIINGDMRIAQRGTSVTGITTSGYYTCDRFDIGGTSFGTFTQSQDTDVPTGQGFTNSIKFLWTTASASLSTNAFLQMHQSIEGQMLQHLKKGTANAETVTLSFWVKSNKIGTYIVNLWDIDNTRLIAKAYTINAVDTWEKKTITFAGDTVASFDNDNGRSLDLTFGLCAGTNNSSGTLQTTWASAVAINRYVGQVNLADAVNNYINFTGIQLEVGDTATPFEHLPYDMELQRCLRYFEKSGGITTPILTANEAGFLITNMYNNIVNNSYYADIYFKVIKRANPTVVTYPYSTPTNTGRWSNDVGTDYGASSATTPAGPKQWGFNVANQSGTTLTIGSQKIIIGNWYADAEL